MEGPGFAAPPGQVGLIIGIQQRMAQGKCPVYERWAKGYNLKQLAAALQFLQGNNLTDYDALAAKTTAAGERVHVLAGEPQAIEAGHLQNLRTDGAVVDYDKPWPAFDGYKVVRYSKKYLSGHRAADCSQSGGSPGRQC